jgi:hypothetical protein
MVIGIFTAPFLTKGLKRFQSLGLMAEISFGIALILAGLSEMAGLAMIIGAYITGLSFSQTDVGSEINERVQGVSEYFVPVFFAVMGMMVDFAAIVPVLGFGMIFAVLAFVGKLVGCGFPALFVGFNLRGAFRIGAGMLPRGEVALIVAGIGLAAGAIGPDMFGVAVLTMLVASIAAPPILIYSFKGKPGYKKNLEEPEDADTVYIELEFPSERAAEYIRKSLAEGFHAEGFYINSIEGSVRSWQIRKEEQVFVMKRNMAKLEIATKRQNESFVRLMMLDTLADFQEFVRSLKSMQGPDLMGFNLMIDMFAQEDKEKLKRSE